MKNYVLFLTIALSGSLAFAEVDRSKLFQDRTEGGFLYGIAWKDAHIKFMNKINAPLRFYPFVQNQKGEMVNVQEQDAQGNLTGKPASFVVAPKGSVILNLNKINFKALGSTGNCVTRVLAVVLDANNQETTEKWDWTGAKWCVGKYLASGYYGWIVTVQDAEKKKNGVKTTVREMTTEQHRWN